MTITKNVYGQELDSLLGIIVSHPDTSQVNRLNEVGFTYWSRDPEKAEQFGKKAKEIADRVGYRQGAADASRIIGISFWARGNNIEALKFFLESLNLAQEIDYQLGIANANGNCGLVYEEQGLYDESLRHHRLALSIFTFTNNQERVATTLNNIGSVHHKLGNYDSAFRYMEKSSNIREAIGDYYGESESLNNLGVMLRNAERFKEADEKFTKVISMRQRLQDHNGLAAALMNLGVSKVRQGKVQEGIYLMQKAKDEADAIKSNKWLLQIFTNLKEAESSRGNYRQALEYADLESQIRKELFKKEKADEVARLQVKYETAKKEKELVVAQAKESRERLYKNITLIILAQVLFIGVYIVMAQRRRNQDREKLLKIDLENANLKQADLAREIEFKNKELAAYTVNFIQKSQLLEQISEGIKEAKANPSEKMSTQLQQLSRLVNHGQQIDQEWADFKHRFEQVHPNFFTVLKENFPDLSTSDLKICVLARLNFNLKDSAKILGIATDSVKMARYRLRKKMNLQNEEDLNSYLLGISA